MSIVTDMFWKQMLTLRSDANYVEMYLVRTERIDRRINIFFALTSTGSIGAWTVWKDYAFVWGAIIAVSQVLNAIKSLLPYKERLRSLSGLRYEIENLAISVEDKWLELEINDYKTADVDIKNYLIETRKKQIAIEHKYFASSSIPQNKKLLKRAQKEAEKYFVEFYSLNEEKPSEEIHEEIKT